VSSTYPPPQVAPSPVSDDTAATSPATTASAAAATTPRTVAPGPEPQPAGRRAGDRRPGRARARWRRDERLRTWAGLAPALLVVGLLFGGAVWSALSSSLGLGAVGASGPSLGAYRRLFADPEFWPSVALTAHVAITSTVLSVGLGVAAALVLRRVTLGRRTVTTLFQLNLPIPHVIGAVAILLLLGQSGFVSRVTASLGWTASPADFPALLFDPYALGVIIQYVWKEVPFVGIVALAILRATGRDLEAAAATLGASAWQRFRFVTLPVLLPGVLSTAIIVFAFAFGTFEVPLLLGASYPAVLPVLAHQRYTDVDLANRPEAMALAVLTTLLVVAVVLVGAALARRSIRQVGT
jgi:putative spermidine/putrescine transport system permease protein